MRKGGLYLAIGDSITWTIPSETNPNGNNLYASRVRKAIGDNYSPIRHLNKGIGGAVAASVVINLPWLSRLNPDLVTIGVGMNDCAGGATTTTSYKNDLKTTIDAFRLRNPDVHIILCTPGRTTDANRTPYIQAFRDAMAEVATEKNTGICRFENAWTSTSDTTYLPDGVHPTSVGHQKLFDLLWIEVQKGIWLQNLG